MQIEGPIDPKLIFPVPFSEIGAGGTMQAWMVLIGSVWVGLAEAAAAKAHAYVRAAAGKSVGTVPPSALRLAELATELAQARGVLATYALNYTRVADTPAVGDPEMIMGARTLKVATSTLALKMTAEALAICGIAGYHRSGPFSLDRNIRDAHGSLVMVNNDRYLRANAELLIARKQI
jgi:acyl-CoA dehydrogenase